VPAPSSKRARSSMLWCWSTDYVSTCPRWARVRQSNVLQYVNCLKSLGNLSREGNVGVVLCNSVWVLPQYVVYVGHCLNDAVGVQFVSACNADVVLVPARGERERGRERERE
jgi:hypothetical protein